MISLFRLLFSMTGYFILVTLLVAVVFGVKLLVIQPTKHFWNTRKAEQVNAEIWASGMADIYTVEATVIINGTTRTTSEQIVCVRKVETSSNFKDGAQSYGLARNYGESKIRVSVSDSHEVTFSTLHNCSTLARRETEQGTPFVASPLPTARIIHTPEPHISCAAPLENGVFRLGLLEVFPLMVVSATTAPVHEVLTRGEFGIADRNKAQPPPPSRLRLPQSFHWDEQTQCWRDVRRECSEVAARYCVPNM